MHLGFTAALMLAAILAASGCSRDAWPVQVDQVTGAGATFPYPVYSRWANAYFEKTGFKVNYQPMGSGAGIRQISARTVDFGASDAPLKPKMLEAHGLMQFPMVMGGIVPVVNLPGVSPGKLRLTGGVLADIYLNVIRKWNNPRIQKLNPDLNLPDNEITVVHRSDGSGTTWLFANYLSKVNDDWAETVGFAKAVAWPVGVGGKGNQGVASYVGRIPYSIGYVSYSYVLRNDMTYVTLRNRAGRFVRPTSENFQSAAAYADWQDAPAMYMVLTNQPGKHSWPITGASFILMHKTAAHPEASRKALKFFDWAYHHGQRMAEKLGYVSMPPNVVQMVEKAWRRKICDGNGESLWNRSTAVAHG